MSKIYIDYNMSQLFGHIYNAARATSEAGDTYKAALIIYYRLEQPSIMQSVSQCVVGIVEKNTPRTTSKNNSLRRVPFSSSLIFTPYYIQAGITLYSSTTVVIIIVEKTHHGQHPQNNSLHRVPFVSCVTPHRRRRRSYYYS